jgi:hypothetical protein
VVFFLGKLPPDAPLPRDLIVVQGRPVKKLKEESTGKKEKKDSTVKKEEEDTIVWVAELIAPSDARNPLDVSVRFTNNVGLSRTLSVPVEVIDPPPAPPPGAKVKRGSIAGVVMEGEIPQKGLKVDLQDAAGKVLVSTNTDEKGAFIFKDLGPGDYNLATAKIASNTRGLTRRPIPLAAGEDKTGIVLKLYRQ